MNTGDTAWLLVSAGLVMLMTPGLALFYGGMVQSKNVLSTFMHSFVALGLVSVQWALLGYTLAFGPSWKGVIGGLDFAALSGIDQASLHGDANHQVPTLAFVAYQCMFAVITPALISGAFAERMKFSAFVAFTLAWTTLVYDPIAHWTWGEGGWLAELGAIDFAGGTVVHLSSGISALVVALVLGKRRGYPTVRHPPHDLTMTVIGAGLLWFGWFGFNGGSSPGGADGTAALALINTHLAAAAGAVTWSVVEGGRSRKFTMLGVASGLVAGLVAITPAAGFVSPVAALAIGVAAGLVCYGAVVAKTKLGYDDALDAFGVHGVGGALGIVLLGVLATTAFNPHGADGLMAGNTAFFGKQVAAIALSSVWAFVFTYAMLWLIDRVTPVKVDQAAEVSGLDSALHGETAYLGEA